MKGLVGLILVTIFLFFENLAFGQIFVLTNAKGDYNWDFMFEAYMNEENNSIDVTINLVPMEDSPCNELYEFSLHKNEKGQYVAFLGEPGDYKNAIVSDGFNPDWGLPNALNVYLSGNSSCFPRGKYKFEVMGD